MKQATVIRLLILGLPAGLIITGTASMLWHFNQPEEETTPLIFGTLAEEITERDVSSYVRNLSEVIGPRHTSSPATLERAVNYLESTLGERNIGYQVARRDYEVDGQTFRNLWLEIPGGKRRNECVVLTAHYDAPQGQAGRNDNASSVAALMALAENFVREKPKLTIRLAFLTNGTAPHVGTAHSGASHFADFLKRQGDQVRAVFTLDGIGAFPDSQPPFPEAIAPYLPPSGPFLTMLGTESSLAILNQASRTLSEAIPGVTVQQGSVLPDDTGAVFGQRDAAAFQGQGFPTVFVAGNGSFHPDDQPVNGHLLTQVTRSLATLVRVLSNP